MITWRHLSGAVMLAACLTSHGLAQGLSAAQKREAEARRLDRPPADSAVEAMTKTLAAQLRCPVCQGLSIQDSPSELSQEMRGVIRDQLRAGRSPEQVRQYFVAKYGEWILLEPEASGFNVIVYALPVLAVLVGLAVVWRFIRRSTRPLGPHSDL